MSLPSQQEKYSDSLSPSPGWFLFHNLFPSAYWRERLENSLDSNSLVRVPSRDRVTHCGGRDVKQLLSHFWDFTAMSIPVLYLHSLKVRPAGQQPLPVFLAHWPGAGVRFWCKPNLQGWRALCPGESCLHCSEPGRCKKDRKVCFLWQQTVVMWQICPVLCLCLPLHPDSTCITLSKGPALPTQDPRLFNITQRVLSDGPPYSLSLTVNTPNCSPQSKFIGATFFTGTMKFFI